MHDLAHVCSTCRTVTIFSADAAYPRRCGRCDRVVREAPSASSFIARPAFFDDDETDDRFTLELGPVAMDAAPF